MIIPFASLRWQKWLKGGWKSQYWRLWELTRCKQNWGHFLTARLKSRALVIVHNWWQSLSLTVFFHLTWGLEHNSVAEYSTGELRHIRYQESPGLVSCLRDADNKLYLTSKEKSLTTYNQLVSTCVQQPNYKCNQMKYWFSMRGENRRKTSRSRGNWTRNTLMEAERAPTLLPKI